MTGRARDTFVAQQFMKSSVQNARILRRKSMLITRNSSESAWVQGIGFRLEKQGTQWMMTQVKALSTQANAGNYFYQSFPTGAITCLKLAWDPTSSCTGFGSNTMELQRIENTTSQLLPEGMSLYITYGSGATPPTCTTALTVLYESINGKLHAYCRASNLEPSINPSTLGIHVQYLNGARYKNYLNLKNNGEINLL